MKLARLHPAVIPENSIIITSKVHKVRLVRRNDLLHLLSNYSGPLPRLLDEIVLLVTSSKNNGFQDRRVYPKLQMYRSALPFDSNLRKLHQYADLDGAENFGYLCGVTKFQWIWGGLLIHPRNPMTLQMQLECALASHIVNHVTTVCFAPIIKGTLSSIFYTIHTKIICWWKKKCFQTDDVLTGRSKRCNYIMVLFGFGNPILRWSRTTK